MDKDRRLFERRVAKPRVREAKPEDIARLVEIDMECFQDVYEQNPKSADDIHEMLALRQGIAGNLMVVGEIDGQIEGFMTCLRTDKDHTQITSWEETTNDGTLIDVHQPDGKNFYIVNLTTTGKGSEHNLSDQLIARLFGRLLEAQVEKAYLLSRIPQFSQWTAARQINFEDLSEDEQDLLAETYTQATKIVDGKECFYDGMLRRYAESGAKPVAVLRDGYGDPASHDYSVLCVFENPLPDVLKKNHTLSVVAGYVVRRVANHPKIIERLP
ncbi:MAG TPA: hypothetical protein VGE13_00910 [Candidatus Saccharimonadales bacterium]